MTYPTATIETTKGTITVELWDDVAPKHTENFQKLAKDGYVKALKDDPNFLAGLNVHKGHVTYKAVADVFGHKYINPSKALN